MGLNINWETEIIEITSPTTEVDAQTLHDFIEDNMATSVGMGYSDIINPEGKVEDPSNPGIYSQIIIILNAPWQIQFWAGSGYTRIYGGKIVGGLADQPMKATGTAGDITVLESPVDGLTVTSGSGVTEQDKTDIIEGVWDEDLTSHSSTKTAGESQQATLYNHAIVIDSNIGVSGTAWNIGTHANPVDNLPDALTILSNTSLDKILLHTDLTIASGQDVSGVSIETMGRMGTAVIFEDGSIADNTAIRYADVSGTLSNGNTLLLEACSIGTIENFSGIMNNVAFLDGAEISIGTWATIIQATAGGAPTNEPELSLGTASVNVSHLTGNLKLKDKTGGVRTIINCTSGNILVDTTCTAGIIQLLGTGIVESDNSGAGCTVDTDGFLTVENIADYVWDEAQAGHTTPDTFGEYLDAVVSGVGGGSITENDIEDIKSLIESQRGGHTWSGNIFYVDPINGTSFGSGATGKKDNPLLSVQDCHDNLVTDSNHDVIMLLSGNPSGSTTMDEAVTLSKRYVFIRGPGRDFLWTTTSVGDTISVTADGIELSGFQISTYTLGVGAGIDIAGSDFTQVKNVWVNYTRGDAISISNSSNTIINSCTLQESGVSGAGHGIAIDPAGGGSSHTLIRNNHISDIQGDAIRLIGGTVEHTIIESNEIHDSTGYGINIGIGVTDSFITGNVLGNNASGDIVDAGTDTIEINNDQWATAASAADAVWDEDSGEHISIGTFGKLLADLLEDTSTTIPGLISTMQTNVTELLGLTGENVKWSSITHDANSLMTAARITLYTDNTLVTPVKSWDVTATYSGSGEITSYQMAEV